MDRFTNNDRDASSTGVDLVASRSAFLKLLSVAELESTIEDLVLGTETSSLKDHHHPFEAIPIISPGLAPLGFVHTVGGVAYTLKRAGFLEMPEVVGDLMPVIAFTEKWYGPVLHENSKQSVFVLFCRWASNMYTPNYKTIEATVVALPPVLIMRQSWRVLP
jgi:hypothetical protein